MQDGALSDAELNKFQVKCFNAPLQPTELAGVKEVVGERLAGVSLASCLVMHTHQTDPGLVLTPSCQAITISSISELHAQLSGAVASWSVSGVDAQLSGTCILDQCSATVQTRLDQILGNVHQNWQHGA